jgi:hypothetical protein
MKRKIEDKVPPLLPTIGWCLNWEGEDGNESEIGDPEDIATEWESIDSLSVQPQKVFQVIKVNENEADSVPVPKGFMKIKVNKASDGSNNLECIHCSKAVPNIEELIKHMKSVHENQKDIISDVTSLKCSCCEVTFESVNKLLLHQTAKNNKFKTKTLICHHCGANYTYEKQLKRHVFYSHEREETNHMCNICDQYFYSETDVNEHVQSKHMTTPKTFECEECGLSYANPESRRRHVQKNHSNVSVRTCSECSIVCKNVVDIVQHFLDKHPGVEPPDDLKKFIWKCETCDKILASKAALYTHNKFSHQKVAKPPVKRKKSSKKPKTNQTSQ